MKALVTSLVSMLLILVGCADLSLHDSDRLDGVVRVFMNTPEKYTFVVRVENGLYQTKSFYCYGEAEAISIHTDVPAGKDMWVEFEWKTPERTSVQGMKIHIHRISDVEGGGWNHGKQGKGTTQVIE